MDIERIRSYLTENPTAYAGLRALDVSAKGREQTVAEGDEIPFIFSIAFVPLIIGYTVLKRLVYYLECGIDIENGKLASSPDHVFIMTSEHEYRTYTFEEVGEQLLDKNRDVMFLCSPSVTNSINNWEKKGISTTSFKHLLRFVTVYELLSHLVRAIFTTYKLRRVTSGEFKTSSLRYAFNSIYLEYIKFSSLEQLLGDSSAIHTYSLMPYQVRATSPDHLYVYQHGVQRRPDEDTLAATIFFPANLLIWGEAWVENFERLTHPETRIHVTGSPWHDYLSRSTDSTATEHDILFIGGSQATNHSDKWARLYEQLVGDIVQACENNEWSLAIKLHPIEDSKWYRERGWERYVVEFDNIRDALNSASIAVTHFSSAFVESIAIETPIILINEWSYGLDEIRPIKGTYFVNSENVEEEIRRVRKSSHDSERISEENRLLDIGKSVDQMLDLVIDET
jgi:hypothetical protein